MLAFVPEHSWIGSRYPTGDQGGVKGVEFRYSMNGPLKRVRSPTVIWGFASSVGANGPDGTKISDGKVLLPFRPRAVTVLKQGRRHLEATEFLVPVNFDSETLIL
ncbi:hypothetical protein PILCRDRAFT_815463 [Piloderma croceum F 1598]|uniref:Uncharacterized protein n=1 Tax=Piloderma croceum (strain F 1598) TaxID=765440 RepID=A0A0C3FS99_PILCF|nr:hypothetical protein PILCRDRAFT_815463 [Piloderma croceum F 1598]